MQKYYFNSDNPPAARQELKSDTRKCMIIGSTLAVVLRFCRGKCHYMKYWKNLGLGLLFGFGYSFYFTNQKVETFVVRSQLGLPVLEDSLV